MPSAPALATVAAGGATLVQVSEEAVSSGRSTAHDEARDCLARTGTALNAGFPLSGGMLISQFQDPLSFDFHQLACPILDLRSGMVARLPIPLHARRR
jgi:hypothetical protein